MGSLIQGVMKWKRLTKTLNIHIDDDLCHFRPYMSWQSSNILSIYVFTQPSVEDSHLQISCMRKTLTAWCKFSLCHLAHNDLWIQPRCWELTFSVFRSTLPREILCNRLSDTVLHLLYCYGVDVFNDKLNTVISKYRPLGRQTEYTPARVYWLNGIPLLTSAPS